MLYDDLPLLNNTPSGPVHICFARPGPWVDALSGVLSGDEHERADRFHFARHRQQYLAAHILTRHLLSLFGAGEAASLRFDAGEFGKPALRGNGPAFNLSHTEGMVGCAVSLNGPIGFDVEAVDGSRDLGLLSGSVFQPVEQAELAASSDQTDTFFRFWTLKEAVMKLSGRGLSLEPDSFNVYAAPGDPLLVDGTVSEADQRFRYALAVTGGAAPALSRFPTVGITRRTPE